jgi:hypothetical protein
MIITILDWILYTESVIRFCLTNCDTLSLCGSMAVGNKYTAVLLHFPHCLHAVNIPWIKLIILQIILSVGVIYLLVYTMMNNFIYQDE